MAERKFELPSGAPAVASKRTGARRAYKSKEYSEAQQRELLANYVFVDPALWDGIKAGDHIRYVTSEGVFRRGGIVATGHFQNPKAAEKRDLMKVSAGYGPSWMVPWDTSQELYVAPCVTLLTLQGGIEGNITIMDGNMQKLAQAVQKLQATVQELQKQLAAR